MMPMRAVLLLGGLLAFSACATKTFSPDQAPEYTITRSFTPFYSERPVEGATTDVSLSEKTRVKLLRKETGYSRVQLEDSREGYVANKNMVVAPPGSQERPFGSTVEESRPKPPRKKRIIRAAAPTPTPVSQGEQPGTSPQEVTAPPAATPAPQAAPKESPAPTPEPTPQATPLEKPKFRL
ncbi:MAG: hypothetical protein WBL40_12480 [Terrimicrobiaceae bacterium]